LCQFLQHHKAGFLRMLERAWKFLYFFFKSNEPW